MTLTSLTNQLQKAELKIAVINQLNKDFLKVGLNMEIPLVTKAENLHTILTDCIEQILNQNHNDKIQHLLYCVDVSEDWIKNLLRENQEASYSSIISYSILRREIQKVFYRDCF